MIKGLAGTIIVLMCFYLFVLAFIAWFKPALSSRFLHEFARSAKAHYLELGVRACCGFALVSFAPHMAFSTLFSVFGWVVLGTTLGLLLVPWQWHQRFARLVIPTVIRYQKLYGLGALALGSFILMALI